MMSVVRSLVVGVCFAAVVSSTATPAGTAPDGEARRDALNKGVAHLATAFERGGLGGNAFPWIRCNDHAVVGLALLCEGSGWNTGKYGELHPALVKYVRDNRFIAAQNPTFSTGVWGHAYTLWYVAELAETAPTAERAELDAFVALLVAELSSWQSKESGGWGHDPQRRPTPNGGYREFSVMTSLSLSALLRARDNGHYVDERVILAGFAYLDKTIAGAKGEPRYSTDANVGTGNAREGAPRGALVMLPYALDRRTTQPVRNLLNYLRSCKDFTGGHGLAALGMCHSALLFATIDEYRYFWDLHGQSILARQKEDGSFTPLRPGERMTEEMDNDLSNAFTTLAIAVPEAPWTGSQTSAPATSNSSPHRIIARARVLEEMGKQPPSMAKLAAVDPNLPPKQLAELLATHAQAMVRETSDDAAEDADWLKSLLDPHALMHVIPAAGGRRKPEVSLAIGPQFLKGIQAQAKVMQGDKLLASVQLRPDPRNVTIRRIPLKKSAGVDAADVRVRIDWTWRGRRFTTEHSPPSAEPAQGDVKSKASVKTKGSFVESKG